MLNSAITKLAPSVLSSNATYLNKVLSSQIPARFFASSVAFNVKSKFETAFEKKKVTLDAQPEKEYFSFHLT